LDFFIFLKGEMGLFGKTAGRAVTKYEDTRGDEEREADTLLAHGTVAPHNAAHNQEVIEVFQCLASKKDSLRVCVRACNLATGQTLHLTTHTLISGAPTKEGMVRIREQEQAIRSKEDANGRRQPVQVGRECRLYRRSS
jgi:hypothetical protein